MHAMDRLIGSLILHLLVLAFLFIFPVEAQFNTIEVERSSQDAGTNFQPSLAVVIGILCIMFSLTFILLVYAKFCHRGASVHGDSPALVRSGSRYSGIDKTVIESLPFFKFSSLKGSKKGLECAVCLSKFEDIEVLRLLPKCKHAFHINCVDQWLEKHSSCPLCRCKVSAEDTAIFTYSNSMRFLRSHSDLQDDSNLELFVQREESHRHGSSRFSIGSSFRKVLNKDDEDIEALIQEQEPDDGSDSDDKKLLHKFNHRIFIADVVLKSRWSNVTSSDLMFLNSEMLQVLSSNRFSSLDLDSDNEQSTTKENDQMMKIKQEIDKKRFFETKFSTISSLNPSNSFLGNPSTSSDPNKLPGENPSSIINSANRRSVSEITGLSRFRNLGIKNNTGKESNSDEKNIEEYRMRRLWLPIARRTVQWFANRERTTIQRTKNTRQTLHV